MIGPIYQLFPRLTAPEYAALRDDIAARGVLVAVEYDEAGNILDGHHRVEIAADLGVDYPRVIRAGMTEDDKRAHVRKINLLRRHLGQAEKRAIIADQLRDTPDVSDRQIAAGLGVSHPTVGTVRQELEGNGQLERFTSCRGLDGRERPRQPASRPDSVYIPPSTQSAREVKATKAVAGETTNIHVSDDSYEWYTPASIIEAVKQVLGWIDLDPASSFEANEVIEAVDYHTREEDGLTQPWAGKVYLNPPYCADLVRAFTQRAADLYEAGTIGECIILVNNATDTQWFQHLLRYPVCLTRRRVKFWHPDLGDLQTRQGQAIFYLGSNLSAFLTAFSPIGTVLQCLPLTSATASSVPVASGTSPS